MIGIHDIGGYHMGPINTHDDKVFHSDWEGLIFGLLMVSATQGTYNLDEFRHEIEKMPPAEYLEGLYYEHWIHSIEELCIRDGFVTREELLARAKAISSGESLPESALDADPEVVQKLRDGAKGIAYVGLGARREDQPQKFKAGDKVFTKTRAVPGHTRLPRFVWNKPGVVLSYSGTYPLADTNAHRLGENPEPTYAVRFEGVDLWGPEAEPNTSVTLDMFESYIDYAPTSA